MCPEKINFNIKTIFTSFCQNTAEFYDKHILLTVLCIFRTEIWLKPRYFALHLTENENVFKTFFPLKYEIPWIVSIAHQDIKLQWEGDLVSKGERCLKKSFRFPLDVMTKKRGFNPNSSQNIQIMIKWCSFIRTLYILANILVATTLFLHYISRKTENVF